MILNATEAVYQWLLFLRGKNGGIVRNRGKFWKNCSQSRFFSRKKHKTAQIALHTSFIPRSISAYQL